MEESHELLVRFVLIINHFFLKMLHNDAKHSRRRRWCILWAHKSQQRSLTRMNQLTLLEYPSISNETIH